MSRRSTPSASKPRRLSLDQTAVSNAVYCEGYARIKRRNVLSWTTRFLVLTANELLIFQSKQDASYRRHVLERLTLEKGRVAPKMELGLELTCTDGRELFARVFSRADQAQWVSALYQLAMKSDARRVKSAAMEPKRRVSFYGSVLVRTIPSVPHEQLPELFYSKQDVEKFSEQAASLLSRTEDAVSLACRSFRKPTLPWRRQLV